MHLFYFLIELTCLLVPLLFSFNPRTSFRKEWKWLLPAIAAVSIFFLAWDIQFSRMHVYTYTADFVIGQYFIGVPVEQLLYYCCVPYLFLFIYYFTRHYLPGTQLKYSSRIFSGLGSLGALIFAGLHYDHWLTVTVFTLIGLILSITFLRKPFWLGHLLISFAICLIPLVVVQGALHGLFTETGTVVFNPDEISGLGFLFIPVESVGFAFCWFTCTIALYEAVKGS